MWGDLKVWSGTHEVVVAPWWYRLYRWVMRKDSIQHYKRVAAIMDEAEKREKMYRIEEALNGKRFVTTGGDSGRQRNSADNLRELKTGEYDGV